MEAAAAPGAETVRELFLIAIKQLVNNYEPNSLDLEYVSLRGNRSIIISKKNHVYYPYDFVSEFEKPNQGFTNSREFCELNVTLKPLRIVISLETFKSSLQLHHRELKNISNSFSFNESENTWHLSVDLLDMLEKVKEIDGGNYQICCGFSKDEIALKSHSPFISCFKYPYTKYVSNKCEGILKRCIPKLNETSVGKLNIPRCKKCKRWLLGSMDRDKRNAVKRKAENEIEKGPAKVLKTDCQSRYAISKLTPRSRKKRIANIRRERQNLGRNLKVLRQKLSKMTLVLNNTQSNELNEIVDLISTKFPDKLNDVINTAPDLQTKLALRTAWKKDRQAQHETDKKNFLKDQDKNETGSKRNRWSMITYRLALAVYVRSPAAFKALKSFNLLQLPSETSLKEFTRANLERPGLSDNYISEQKILYEKMKIEKLQLGHQPPLGEGILIFDEVKVIGKVLWNSTNNELMGLAMTLKEMSSLHDVYSFLNDETPKKTEYMLQFLWRDISNRFDILGPYISSAGNIKQNLLYGVLMDVIALFEMHDFHVRGLVCDGASTNLGVMKTTVNHRGSFGFSNTNEHEIPVSFPNPFWPFHDIYWIICPSHELKNLIAALYQSKPNSTRLFSINNVEFGWNAILQLYDVNMKRKEKNLPSLVKGLQKRYVYRDPWTRLNVKPAKVMQQEEVLAALYEMALPTNDPKPPNSDEILETYNFLYACSQLFENGILFNDGFVRDMGHQCLQNIKAGFQYFVNWLNSLVATYPGLETTESQRLFLSWQTWDRLRIMVYGFIGLVDTFINDNPGYFICPGWINGSAVETLFSQFRFSMAGKLSGINYNFAVRNRKMKSAVGGRKFKRDDYRDAPLSIVTTNLKRLRKLKTKSI